MGFDILSANLLGVGLNNIQVSAAYGANSIILAEYMNALPHLSDPNTCQ